MVSEKNYVTKWRKDVYLRYKLVPIIDNVGKLVYVICTFEDILKEKEIDLLKEDLEQRKVDFISMMNHELRTPVSVLQGYISFLKMNPNITSSDRDSAFNALTKNIKRLERLIVDSQTLSYLQRQIFSINKEKTNLGIFFSSFIETYRTRLKDQIQFDFEACNSVEVNIDPDRIQQVIDNILDNAIKHTCPEERKISLKCTSDDTTAEIKVIDNGIGIKEQDKERIFEQFVSIPSKYCIKGTGIGLFISREIVNSHDGTLTVFSKGEDKGSTFTIKLPIN